MSAQPCGCDPDFRDTTGEIGWVCEAHREGAMKDTVPAFSKPFVPSRIGPTHPSNLPSDPKERKKFPIMSGLLRYFPDAVVEVSRVSWEGNNQHNPGQPLHWDRAKSMDQEDTLLRHLMAAGTRDTDGQRHSAKVAWRALAALQLEIEAEREKEAA